jgi:DHA1 family inner membrane transport protein
VFTFLEPLLTEHAGFDANGVFWMLLLFGAATFVGNLVGGRLADQLGTIIVIRAALAGLIATFIGLLLTKDSPIALAVNLAVWGFFAFLISPAVQTHTVLLAEA